ncbi:hypothetical protein BJV77DRAFT_396004 [Russula vinacea]|nr:hypothetical protein BJV77DRAFT_396004 [Russula vinacea]
MEQLEGRNELATFRRWWNRGTTLLPELVTCRSHSTYCIGSVNVAAVRICSRLPRPNVRGLVRGSTHECHIMSTPNSQAPVMWEIDGTHTVIGCLSNCAPVTTSQWPAKLFAASKVGCIHHICRFIGGAVLATETLKNSRCKSFKLSQEGHRSPFDGGSRLLTDLLIAPSTCLPHHA